MDDARGKKLSKDSILAVLSTADELARSEGDALKDGREQWVEVVEFLGDGAKSPLTYLPMLTVMLVARSVRGADELDVFDIQAGTSDKGYSASSVARYLITFAGHQSIDLRSTSTGVVNNQPFTFKPRVVPDMAGRKDASAKSDKVKVAFARFYEAAGWVQDLTQEEAAEVLALVFQLRRREAVAQSDLHLAGGRDALSAFADELAEFVDGNSEEGKVGQAFAAALLDLLYSPDSVVMGGNHDPSFTSPGDVQVARAESFWLWSEVKQTAIVSADVKGFVDKVHRIGGDRIIYFALANHRYPQHLDLMKLDKQARKEGVDLTVYSSAEEALSDLLNKAPGRANEVASDLANRMTDRLREAKVSSALVEAWEALLASVGAE